ncbi:unnamed protein product [Ixodes pacificus]
MPKKDTHKNNNNTRRRALSLLLGKERSIFVALPVLFRENRDWLCSKTGFHLPGDGRYVRRQFRMIRGQQNPMKIPNGPSTIPYGLLRMQYILLRAQYRCVGGFG